MSKKLLEKRDEFSEAFKLKDGEINYASGSALAALRKLATISGTGEKYRLATARIKDYVEGLFLFV